MLLACFWASLTSPAWARPAHKKALADYLGPFLDKKLNNCRTCHVPYQPGTEDEKPHNVFGARLGAVRKELSKASKATDIASRLEAIADEDSDGDGVSNLLELLAGHAPGDAKGRPSVAELDAAKKKIPAFRKLRESYPWKPFDVVKRPALPDVKNAAWLRNPIDAFIAAEQEARGLKPRPEAPRSLLVRRVYLDLVGLPPTRDELHAALQDQSADWYEKVVDRLLASPRYGERWGRHWMDVWRYSDWYGYAGEVRHSQPHIWRWRDWIIESINADKGYDRMIVEMLAGDELAPDDPQIVRATGYLARNFHSLPNTRDKWLQETVDHTFQAFLGLTIGCARCHDHMYDPLTHKDYYQARAFFEPHRVRVDLMPGTFERINLGNGYSTSGNGLARVFDAEGKTPTYLYTRGDETKPDKSASLTPGVPAALGGRLPEITPIKLPSSVYDPEKRAIAVKDVIASSEAKITQAIDKLAKSPKGDALALAEADIDIAKARHAALLATLDAERLEDADKIDSDEGKQAAASAVRAQRTQAMLETRKNLYIANKELADPKTNAIAGKKVAAIEKVLAKLDAEAKGPPSTAYVKREIKSYPRESTGRRLAFARWIADTENPLAARVAMNHLWLRHFGQGLVARSFDFGKSGAPPTHPALLDWLASEFMHPSDKRSDAWSMKRMHRLMVTSATYRLASTSDASSAALDADNRFYWRMMSRRMEAEVVRDSLFHLSGSLDFAMGGPDIDPAKGPYLPRRSIYFRHAQEHQVELLKIFDTASVVECYERVTSVVPHQALALSNSDLAIKHARLSARMLHEKAGMQAETFVKAAFEQVLARMPNADEVTECVRFLDEQAKLYKGNPGAKADAEARQPSPDPQVRARENLLRILINHNDFVTIR